MLDVKKVNTFYGKVQVLWDVSLKVVKKKIVAFIGANGAGKTTLINTISGLLRPASGTIKFLGKNIDGLAPHSIVERGICYIPEGRRLFPDMSVRENLEMGAYLTRAWKQKGETLELADRAYVLENGRVILSGEGKKLLKKELIKKAYLGL